MNVIANISKCLVHSLGGGRGDSEFLRLTHHECQGGSAI